MDTQLILQKLARLEERLSGAMKAELVLQSDGSGFILMDGEEGARFDSIDKLPIAFEKEMQIINEWLLEREDE
jgi:hypothetical protein